MRCAHRGSQVNHAIPCVLMSLRHRWTRIDTSISKYSKKRPNLSWKNSRQRTSINLPARKIHRRWRKIATVSLCDSLFNMHLLRILISGKISFDFRIGLIINLVRKVYSAQINKRITIDFLQQKMAIVSPRYITNLQSSTRPVAQSRVRQLLLRSDYRNLELRL